MQCVVSSHGPNNLTDADPTGDNRPRRFPRVSLASPSIGCCGTSATPHQGGPTAVLPARCSVSAALLRVVSRRLEGRPPPRAGHAGRGPPSRWWATHLSRRKFRSEESVLVVARERVGLNLDSRVGDAGSVVGTPVIAVTLGEDQPKAAADESDTLVSSAGADAIGRSWCTTLSAAAADRSAPASPSPSCTSKPTESGLTDPRATERTHPRVEERAFQRRPGRRHIPHAEA